MTDQLIAKRPVVFTWAELQKYPTLEARYAETLPFNDLDRLGACYWHEDERKRHCKYCIDFFDKKAKLIKRTGKRWAWFSAARDLDDQRGERLGTLGYLPWEIRQQIFGFLLYERCYQFDNKTTFLKEYFDSKPHVPKFTWYNGYLGMQYVSPSTKVEIEYCYLTNTTWVFNDPESLEAFLDMLSIYQQSLLRTFEICLPCPPVFQVTKSNWERICDRLPRNLVSINFNLRKWYVCGVERAKGPDGEWFICDNYPAYPENLAMLRVEIELLNIIGKRARRFAARAKIGLSCNVNNVPPNQDDCVRVRVLDELEPWSEDWLEWWENDTKVDLDGREGGENMA